MKRLFFILLLIGCVTPVTAQRWTIWYGVNYSGEMKSIEPLYQWRFANAGVDYAFPVSRWDFTLGAGLNTKGGYKRVNYAQLEGNAGYRFIDRPGSVQVSAWAGPFFGLRVADNLGEVPAELETKPTMTGWQAGLLMKFKFIALKVGYEQALTGYWGQDVFNTRPLIGYSLMTTSTPHSLFIRLGYAF